MNCQQIRSVPFDEAWPHGHVEVITEEIDKAYADAAIACRFEGPRDAKILYSPLHGVGAEAVLPLLAMDGFKEVVVYGPHEEKSGDFPERARTRFQSRKHCCVRRADRIRSGIDVRRDLGDGSRL